jgi:predicted ribosomally synthesized peptide with nif11-like leader
MSQARVRAFFEKVESDKQLQRKLKTLSEENEREAIARVVKLASAAGYDFTPDELRKARSARVEAFPGLRAPRAGGDCCYYAQGCMPGFSGGGKRLRIVAIDPVPE